MTGLFWVAPDDPRWPWWSQTWHKRDALLFRNLDSTRIGYRRNELLRRIWNTWNGDGYFSTQDWSNLTPCENQRLCILWRTADIIDMPRDSFGNPELFEVIIDHYYDSLGGALAVCNDADPNIARARWRVAARRVLGFDDLPREKWEVPL